LNSELRTLNTGARSESKLAGKERVYDLEERPLNFSVAVIDVSEKLLNTRAGNHIAGQLLRSGTSPYGNHGEAQEPESADDFIHKLKICLKELREARRWARLIERKQWRAGDAQMAVLLSEVEELIRIFKASIQTAQSCSGSTPHKKSSIERDRVTDISKFRVQSSEFEVS
jgi:four helix bundle protein